MVVAETTTATSDTVSVTSNEPSQFMNIVMIVLFVVLVLILIVLAMIISLLKKYLAQKEGVSEEDQELVNQSLDLGAAVKSNVLFRIGCLCIYGDSAQSGDRWIVYSRSAARFINLHNR